MQIINKCEHPEYAIVNAYLIIIPKEAFYRIQQEKAWYSNVVIDNAGIKRRENKHCSKVRQLDD